MNSREASALFDYCPNTGQLSCKATGRVLGFKKAGSNYLRFIKNKKPYYVHRIAALLLYGDFDGVVDHINRDESDNRAYNLRVVSQQQNTQNQRVTKGNASGLNGVVWDKNRNRWAARITVDGKSKALG